MDLNQIRCDRYLNKFETSIYMVGLINIINNKIKISYIKILFDIKKSAIIMYIKSIGHLLY